jgi:3'(2'), 5'-bisphosphate nucleotidase
MNKQLEQWTQNAFDVAMTAGEKILAFYQQNTDLQTEYKADESPLTIADKAAHDIIFQGLSELVLESKTAPVLSEEGTQIPFVERQAWDRYWCVDPLDGTKDFLERNDEFTVNIALIVNHQPVIGVIYVPAQRCGYMAWRGGGAYRCKNGQTERIFTQTPTQKPLRVLVSRHHGLNHLEPWLARFGETTLIPQGSALKFCSLAAGEADIMLRTGPTSEWDNAAGQCVLEEAGGMVFTPEGDPLTYNRSGTLLQGKFIAVGDKSFNWSNHYLR